ncbi:MAG: galactose oxidase [Gemmatimonadaceae bacterium]
MQTRYAVRPTVLLLLATRLLAAQSTTPTHLPHPVSNNAVASGRIGDEWWIFSALGVDSSKRWSGITRTATAWSSRTKSWTALPDVPGANGRLAATAQVVRGKLFVIGGYAVDSLAHETSMPNVDIYDPRTTTWIRGAPIPLAVDDAVSGVYRDSLIYLVSGWHDTDNVPNVQVYDVVRDRWSKATPIPGAAVFGHSGALSGNTLVFIDGAVRQPKGAKYRMQSQSWTGTIEGANPLSIIWRAAPTHPGPPIYRAAAGVCGARVIFAGGTDNPYNYDGIGYNGVPSAPRADVIAFDTKRRVWSVLAPLDAATMDHRALAVVERRGFVVGGMRAGQRVSDGVASSSLGVCSY